jgi:CheY-like chemotaxis protein
MRTLLLADDSITVQRVIGLTFAAEDFEIVTVSDGQAAIDRITSQPPDIVLAGSAMPNVNGYDVASFVRGQTALKHLPVLLLTGAFESVDLERLKTSGVTGVLEKPLDPTVVISRVKELLGIKGDAPPAPAPGRPAAAAKPPAARKPPVPRDAPASAPARRSEPPAARAAKAAKPEEPRESPGLPPDPPAAEGDKGSGADYLDMLDAAFDSLDQKLAGREEEPRYTGPERRANRRNNRDGRNPAPPLPHQGTVVDPRSPSRRPSPGAPQEAPPATSAIFEVNDEWFAGDNKGQEESLAEQKELAAEMGIRDMEIPDGPVAAEAAAPDATAPNADLDFEFGPDGEPKPAPAPPPPPPPPESQVADDFAALLAFEQGEQPHPPAPPAPAPVPAPVIVQAAAPEITDAMLDQIAERVAVRLNAESLGEHLRAEITATIRETVHAVVSETSERLVRDEIARVKAQAERDTH